MKNFFFYYLLFTFLFSINVSFANHANEPFAFDRMHKYKIEKSENYHQFETYLENNLLSKKVEEQLKNRKQTGLVSYLLYED